MKEDIEGSNQRKERRKTGTKKDKNKKIKGIRRNQRKYSNEIIEGRN
jgi:hypothetical protein